jgi:branched-chain amino acid transport system permease protein
MILGIVFVVIVTVFSKGICGGIRILWHRLTWRGVVQQPLPAPAEAKLAVTPVPAAIRTRSALGGRIILEARNVVKRYGGLTAVDDVSFAVHEGEIRALIGPNGAGKTTFFNMLSGTLRVTSGEVHFAGEAITRLGSTLVCQRGVAKSFQINQLFPSLSVRDNIRISALARRYGRFHPSMLRNVAHDADTNADIDAAITSVQLSERANALASDLAYGEKRRLEIGLALATKPRVLLLDEPTAGMSPGERGETVQLLKRIATGITIVIVEHDMDVVFGLADRVTVFFNGRKIAEDSPEAIQANAEVRNAYLGNPTS